MAAVGYTVYAVNAITKSNRTLLSIKGLSKKTTGQLGESGQLYLEGGSDFRHQWNPQCSGFLSVVPDYPESSSPMGWEVHGLT